MNLARALVLPQRLLLLDEPTASLDAGARRALVGRVAHHFGTPWAPPRYLDAAALAARPRRLLYAFVDGIGAGYWHSVPAGTDTSHRPGNVFAHVVLDRRPDAGVPALRSSDLLGSRHWLVPFDAAEVLDAELDAIPDPPWGGVSRDSATVAPPSTDDVSASTSGSSSSNESARATDAASVAVNRA